MLSPLTGKEMQLLVRPSTVIIRREPFPVMYHIWHCADTGEEFEDEPQVELNIRQAEDQYRNKYNLPFPEEIRAIREQYGISAAKMSEVLRFGINQYKQYEHGELPSESNASLIFLARHPQGFCQLIELSSLSLEEKKLLFEKAEAALEKKADWRREEWTTEMLMGSLRPDVERGFKQPDLKKFGGMVQFFAQCVAPYKTQLNKLLFYADFLHFKRHRRSISGTKYRAIDMGPVPNNFDGLFQYAENEKFVRVVHHEFPNGSIGTRFSPGEVSMPVDFFSKEEIDTLQTVHERFKNTNGVEIIQISHAETAWEKNVASRSIINYLDAYILKAIT